ncbi:hypothetical protein C9I92_03595 [Photobacterium ganghwense]|uniref:Glycosyltransferase 2-like domain-containing protein n=1 Tax=Photobacterium ganghwense TaxID=320778 RepID=A0A0J1HH60_9GAMM|nr:glycosyltransferase family 2 protein [Photobacterium ganghwense]KLV10948.1 hypothetical protein ABT57_03310 [Photobacterium ganghwense]PSU11201.1 hypothetical protein C9I92_03595 [Photobacterium ganghwense]QSV13330.1 glycosyltransferase family 2 protein [Photobacterium ganghwense]
MSKDYPISVIMTLFNSDAYLKKSLSSLFEQTLDCFEIVIIDDGSTDNSLSTIKSLIDFYPHRKNHIRIISRDNRGVAFSRAEGINLSSGEYVIFMDSDDWVHKDWLIGLLEMARNQESDIVICDFYNVYESDRLILKKEKIEGGNDNWFRQLLIGNVSNSNCNKLVKRELYIKNEINFHSGFDMGEDFYVTMRLLFNAKKISYLPKGLYYYNRTNESSLTSIYSSKSLNDLASIVSMTESFLLNSGSHDKYKKELVLLKIRTKQTILKYATTANKKLSITTFDDVNKNIFSLGSKSLILFYLLWIMKLDFFSQK